MSDLSRLPMVLNGNASEVLNRLRADGRGRNLRHLERIARCGQRQSAGAGHLHAGPRFRTGVPGFCCPRRAGVSGRVRTVGRRGWGPAPRPPEYFCEVQMADGMVLAWSFPDDRHCDLAALETGCSAHLPVDHADVDASCRGLVACLVPADGAGLRVVMRIAALAPDPLAHLAFDDVMLPREALIGAAAAGFGTAMAVHAVFRPKIGAADVLRLNIARRVLA